MINGNLNLAIQRKGRLSDKSLELLKLCSIEIENYAERLAISAKNFPINVLFLRDDDIPEYVRDGVADLGIVGEDVIAEKKIELNVVEKLGFGNCKLMIAYPENHPIVKLEDLNGKRIATSYKNILKNFLIENNIKASIVELSGSVEIAPSLGVADCICDIVSTGTTLMMNKLKPSFSIFESQAVLIANENTTKDEKKMSIIAELQKRIRSILAAKNSKYLMMNIPKSSLEQIIKVLPALKSPTILNLADPDMLAVHVVIPTDKFWSMIDDLKKYGASGILLLPIENMII